MREEIDQVVQSGRSEPSLSPEPEMFSGEQPTCECEFEGLRSIERMRFLWDQSSELGKRRSPR